jgi:tRNA(Ile)-lysidine synthetase-like protein
VKYLVAVSGGIDSVVLLHMLVKNGHHELIVAHFDHGIREDSEHDARFVRALAKAYHLPFVTKREELGGQASEELARTRRYAFLREQAKKHGAVIATAHHADDIVETIAINLIRGTGWRGAAVLDTLDLARPLLHLTKENIRTYALMKRLEWVEDSTNDGTQYLRNRVRRKIAWDVAAEDKRAVVGVRTRQVALKKDIENALRTYIRKDGEYPRHLFIQVEPAVACELLRAVILAHSGISPTRPQCERALLAVKTARPGTTFEVAGGVALRFSQDAFIVETP